MPARFLEADLSKVSTVDLLDENNLYSFAELAVAMLSSTQALAFWLAKLGYVQLYGNGTTRKIKCASPLKRTPAIPMGGGVQ